MSQGAVAVLALAKCLPARVKISCSHFSSDVYVQMALHGYSLRHAFTTASQLLHRHQRRMNACHGAADAALLPGKVSAVHHVIRALHDGFYCLQGLVKMLYWDE